MVWTNCGVDELSVEGFTLFMYRTRVRYMTGMVFADRLGAGPFRRG